MIEDVGAAKFKRERVTFEIMLMIVAIGMTYLVFRMGGYKMVALNLFYLPIVLSGYYLGRTSAGVLALFCALAVTVAATASPTGFAAYDSPVMIGLALTVWASVLGMTAILVGTLCDERAKKVNELHQAYVGVVEVMSRYLQSGDRRIKARCVRIAELCQEVASSMRLSRKEIDDIRVGALLHDLGNIEITTKVLARAVDTLETSPGASEKHTFMGTDLVHSLSSVLQGAFPLIVGEDDNADDSYDETGHTSPKALPVGARIIKTVRAYDRLTVSDVGVALESPRDAIDTLRRDGGGEYDIEVLDVLKNLLCATRNPGATRATIGAS
jgi:HD-GYP domain-containing protein (c-di-GMP phosphodiesterase class II)